MGGGSLSSVSPTAIPEVYMSELTVLPWRKSLKTVDHGTIVTVGGTGENDEAQTDVGLPKARVGVPSHLGEFTSGKAEVTFSSSLHCSWWIGLTIECG